MKSDQTLAISTHKCSHTKKCYFKATLNKNTAVYICSHNSEEVYRQSELKIKVLKRVFTRVKYHLSSCVWLFTS